MKVSWEPILASACKQTFVLRGAFIRSIIRGYTMMTYGRRSLIGLLAGACIGVLLMLTLQDHAVGILLGSSVGICSTLAFRPAPKAYAQSMLAAAASGLGALGRYQSFPSSPFIWPTTTMDSARDALTLSCSCWLGALWSEPGAACPGTGERSRDARSRARNMSAPKPSPVIETRIVIIGGGFAGMTTAEHLERLFGADPTVSFTLVSASSSAAVYSHVGRGRRR